MCGIAGILLGSDAHRSLDEFALLRMRSELAHRGPDASQVWTSADRRAGLVHTRLSIIDLTDSGAQPMASADGRFRLVFNGEIYNYVELRNALVGAGHVFRGTSDTEVLLKLFELDGMDCLNKLDGMFAFAVYDIVNHELWLARDHMGEKPLYVVEKPGLFAFASEVRALVAGGAASCEPDLQGVAYLLRQGSIPPPHTHLRDVEFLPAAHWYHVDRTGRRIRHKKYWTIPFVPECDTLMDSRTAVELLRETLKSSTALRGRADVPVGAFLSGGVDSSAVCVALIEGGVTNLRTFTVTLPGHPKNEGERARKIAQHLGLDHTEITLEADESAHWLSDALRDMDVPSIDGPNTWLVSRAVHNAGMKVACSGIGGDEMFCGYPSFLKVPLWHRRARWLPQRDKLRGLSRIGGRWAIPRWSRMLDAIVAGGSLAALWFAKRGLFADAQLRELLTDAAYSEANNADPIRRIEALDCPTDLSPERQVSFYELSVYMHDQLLRDTDAMSMAHGLEVRAPLIARPIVELVAGFSTTIQRPIMSKPLLRRAIVNRLPAEFLSRDKLGFSLDWSAIWARGGATQLDASNVFRAASVRRIESKPIENATVVPPQLVLRALSQSLDTAKHLASTGAI